MISMLHAVKTGWVRIIFKLVEKYEEKSREGIKKISRYKYYQ